MVGVPGRSRACLTCRRRRKGCGFQRPSCLQCQKAGISCGGYDKPRIFVNSTKQNPLNGKGYSAAHGSSSCSEPKSERPNPVQRRVDPVNLSQLDDLSRLAYEEKFLGLFWSVFYPPDEIFVPGVSKLVGGCMPEAQQLYRVDSTLRVALLATSLCAIGRRDDQPWMMQEGSRLYGRALRDINISLGNLTRARQDSFFLAVKVLSLYEVSGASNHALLAGYLLTLRALRAFFGWNPFDYKTQCISWEKHNTGELALLTARTPGAHVRGSGHHIFTDGRLHMILPHIRRRKKSMLSTPQWKTIPWTEITKCPKDALVDILVDMPGLLEELDRMRACSDINRKTALQQKLMEKCWTYDQGLLNWVAKISPSPETLGTTYRSHNFEETSTAAIAQAHGLSLYWTACLVLYSTIRLAAGQDARLPERVDARIYIRNIANVLPTLLRPGAGMWGQLNAILPLSMALQYAMVDDSAMEERKMLIDNFRRPGGRAMSGFLLSMNCCDPPLVDPLEKMDGSANMSAKAKAWVGT